MLKRILFIIIGIILFNYNNTNTKNYLSAFNNKPIIKVDKGLGDDFYPYQWGLSNIGLVKEYTSITDKDEKIISFIQEENNFPGDMIMKKAAKNVDINIEPAWNEYEKRNQRREVVVAIIDTGVDIRHRELKDSIWVNTAEIPDDNIDNDKNGYVDDKNGWNFVSNNNKVYVSAAEDEHGTHHAGTISALWDAKGVAGIADSKYVKLMILKVLGEENGKGNYENIKSAIKYAKDNGASICNISMGSFEYDKELEDLIKQSNMLFVVAAGNGDESNRPIDLDKKAVYPASFNADNIITVANIRFDGNIDESSNYGVNTVDLAAPGYQILSTIPSYSYGFMSGTSMSAPMVSGGLALIYSTRLDMDIYKLKKAALNTVKKYDGLKGKIKTGGVFDVYAAMMYRE